MTCPACGTENRAGRKFCSSCGAPLARACPACGAANEPDDRFCGECGAPLAGEAVAPTAQAERRLVSVLFGDLVGFTTLSEDRDPEEVRELLSRYFETARRVVERYGGTIEKFIGDAVMAVWGTPVAREDDPERAVRAGLELVDVVAGLGDEVGAPALAMRVGVVTGEAAVTVGAEGQGMVAGDLVNTASRVQSVAEAGTVLVGERTRRASEAAVAYADAGEHSLKGKSEPVPLWRAERVIAYRGGEGGRATGLEPPFVGREGELRLVKDLFHATTDEARARLVSIVGIAGIGKTRLSSEFERYVDGLVGDVYWHRGRCLAYGDGVAYWALAEMVRMRAGITEQDGPEAAAGKLEDSLKTYLGDVEERAWVEQRLAQLLGVTEQASFSRDDLFAAWRLFFERLAERNPTVLVFEDLQWADPALLDFVDYLLDWSRGYPLYVLTLARPDLAEKHQGWGGTKRDFTSLTLEPLRDEAMDTLLAGLVPGLPEELGKRIRDRAEGVPLYAVETVRMLLDRGLLRRDGDVYAAVGEVGSLEVPETLHALIAARLDDLEPAERRVVEDAAVLGKTFTKPGLAALTGISEAELEPLLAALVRKDLLTVQSDPRSPERGNYGFLQALVQRIAHDTLSRKEQKVRHLAAAEYLEQSWGSEETEIVEVIASHYLDAHRADPAAPDAAELRMTAREALARAGRRAASLAANEQAQRYFEEAAALADERALQAELLLQAGVAADDDRRAGDAIPLLEQAIDLWTGEGLTHPASRGEARLAMACFNHGQVDTAVERMGRSFDVLRSDEPDADLAMLAAQLARFRVLTDDLDGALEPLEFALEIGEALLLPDVVSDALNTKALIITLHGRGEEGLALMRHAVDLALEHDVAENALRAYFNLSFLMAGQDRIEEAARYDELGQDFARRRGNRQWEETFEGHLRANRFFLGHWDEIDTPVDELEARPWDELTWTLRLDFAGLVVPLFAACGRFGEAQMILEHVPAEARAETQERVSIALARATLAHGEGRWQDALDFAVEASAVRTAMGTHHPLFKHALAVAVDAAVCIGDLTRAEEMVEPVRGLPPARRSPFIDAQIARYDAHVAAAAADAETAERRFRAAESLLRETGARFWLAVVLLEHLEWLATSGQESAELLTEAREIFDRLGARPWVERADAVAPARV